MTPSARIAFLEGELRKARALGAAVGAVELPDWAWSLTRQERALVDALRAAYPGAVRDAHLDQVLPHHDHAAERGHNLLPTIVSRARRKIPGGIERVTGLGYRLSAVAAAALDAEPTEAATELSWGGRVGD